MTEIAIGILVGIVSTIVGGKLLQLLNREHDERLMAWVFDPADSNSRKNFDDVLARDVRQAREEIVQYGEGFSTELGSRRAKAQGYIDAAGEALRKNQKLRLIRIQTKKPADEGWREMLLNFRKLFPDQFSLYLHDNRAGEPHLMAIVLIDAKTLDAKVHLLISKARRIGGQEKVSLAHIGLRLAGSRGLAAALDNRLDELRDVTKHVKPVETDDDWPS